MDRFEEMQTFVRVAETLSVTRAAAQLNIAPSAISRRVRDLEARLGTQLLQRTTRRVALTDAGRAFYRRSVALLADLAEAEAEVTDERCALTGTLRLTVPLSLAMAALTDIIAEFMKENPALVVDVDLNDRQVDLVAENIDLAIRVGRLANSSLIARRLAGVRGLVCASPAFLAEHGTPRTPDELSALPALCYANAPAPEIWTYADPAGREGSVRVTPQMLANNGDALCEAAASGLGVTYQPSFIAFRAIEAGRLVPILTDHVWAEAGIYAVYPPTRHLPLRARAFIDFLAERIGPEPFWEQCLRRRDDAAGEAAGAPAPHGASA